MCIFMSLENKGYTPEESTINFSFHYSRIAILFL